MLQAFSEYVYIYKDCLGNYNKATNPCFIAEHNNVVAIHLKHSEVLEEFLKDSDIGILWNNGLDLEEQGRHEIMGSCSNFFESYNKEKVYKLESDFKLIIEKGFRVPVFDNMFALKEVGDDLIGYIETKKNHTFSCKWDKTTGECWDFRDKLIMKDKYDLEKAKYE